MTLVQHGAVSIIGYVGVRSLPDPGRVRRCCGVADIERPTRAVYRVPLSALAAQFECSAPNVLGACVPLAASAQSGLGGLGDLAVIWRSMSRQDQFGIECTVGAG
jgi:hypothetical protein